MAGKASSSIVPHHKVDAAVHAKAKEKARAEGVSLSQVAEAGLRAYAVSAGRTTREKAQAKVASGRLTHDSPLLPETTCGDIVDMVRKGDERLTAFLVALHEAGWSYATLAKPLGISRQAIHLRVSGWDGASPGAPLPPVPRGNKKTTFPAHPASKIGARFDWAMWVDRDIYALAAEQARTNREPLRDVMERILSDYLCGALIVAPPAPKTADDKTANTPQSRRRK